MVIYTITNDSKANAKPNNNLTKTLNNKGKKAKGNGIIGIRSILFSESNGPNYNFFFIKLFMYLIL